MAGTVSDTIPLRASVTFLLFHLSPARQAALDVTQVSGDALRGISTTGCAMPHGCSHVRVRLAIKIEAWMIFVAPASLSADHFYFKS
jgi:hypothetical protein